MIDPVRGNDVTIRDVMSGLEAMEKWARQLREALATLDQGQSRPAKPLLVAVAPAVQGGACPPHPGKGKGRPKKGGKKK